MWSHALADKGGRTPDTGFHSVIDNPDPVRRVAPPTTTMASTRAATENSHTDIANERSGGRAPRAADS